MKKTLTAGLVLAGILAVSGSALAAPKKLEVSRLKTKETYEKHEEFSKKHPPLSRDKRPIMSPDGKLPPKGAHSRDKRPPMPPRSMDRRPPCRPNSMMQHQNGNIN